MIEVGEYVRTENGYITKICECLGKDIGYKNMQHYDVDNFIHYRGFIIYKEDIKAHSKNIIDLIEVGDIVEIQNKLDGAKTIFDLNKYTIDIYKEQIKNESIKILSILTHEQYEQNCYKVGDIE